MKLVIPFLFISSVAYAQGSVAIGTPIVPPTPPTINLYNPHSLTIRPGANATITVELVASSDPTNILSFEYPRDCGSFGSTVVDGKEVPNPPTCANLDTSAEVNALLNGLNTANLTTRNLWRRVFDRLVADFPSRFPGGGTVQ